MGKAKVDGWWMQDKWQRKPAERMVTLLHNSHTPASIKVTLNETQIGTDTMRLVFNTSVTVDVSATDDELRKAFMQLITEAARTVYGPAAMLAKGRPIIKITETSRDGMRDIDMMTGQEMAAEEVDG